MEAGWSAIMEKLIDTGSEYLQDQVRWQTGMKEELQRLRDIKPKIQAVVALASSQAHIGNQNSPLNKWMWQLRDAVDEADDVLDDFEYMMHEEQLMTRNKEQRKERSIASFLIERTGKKILEVGERALKIDPNLKRLEEAVQKLHKVSAEVSTFLSLLESTKQEQQEQLDELYKTRETGSLPKNDLIGRGEDKQSVMQWLRKPSNEEKRSTTNLYKNISLLSIVGHGGMGKTTLLQHVYEDEITKGFDLKIWVCVSNNFDAKRVIADMLEYLKKERPRLESIGTLQESLKSAVKSKKFLLVLDDIWGEEEEQDKSKWETVLAPLASGSLGSKILLTTRMDSVASMISKVIKEKKETIALQGLEKDECLRLLNSYAFADVENPDGYKKLKHIAGEIVKELSGSPLAAKVIGGVLNSSFDERHWLKILNNAIGSQNDILTILRLSYIFLPKHLQNCFAFCAIFPEDHMFDKDDLIRMWISLGFIQTSYNQGETLEDIGGNYFDVLVKKSFFDKFEHDVTCYKMHDLLHQLAQSVSQKECLRVWRDEELPIPKTIRHLSVATDNLEVLKKMGKVKKLRSLFLFFQSYDKNYFDVISEIFKESRSIRLLAIGSPHNILRPKIIEYLKHLRYLGYHWHTIINLPESISHLYHLEYIIGDKRAEVSFNNWPRDMNNLSNLRYTSFIRKNFFGIGELKSLQNLQFYIENEAGYRIGELEHMNELRELSIFHLKNTKDAKEACNSKLCEKKNLTYLSLDWRVSTASEDIVDPDLDEKVLDNIQPHKNLKELCITAYMGVRSARWMNNLDLINLEYIILRNCLGWRILPSFGQLPYLKSLYLDNMPKIERFDAAVVTEDVGLFPCLTQLHLERCPNLQELPFLPSNVELTMDNTGKDLNWLKGINNCCSISIKNCSNLISLKGRQEVETTENRRLIFSELIITNPSVLLMQQLRSITPLKKLTIQWNDEMASFPIEAEQISSSLCEVEFELKNIVLLKSLPDLPPSLCKLHLSCLNNLDCLPSCLPSLPSLQELHIFLVPQLRELPVLPPSLLTLQLSRLSNLDCLPSCLPSLSSLKTILICDIPMLRGLPDLPPSLCELHLENLKNLDCLPSCLPSLSSLKTILISDIPKLRGLPDLPPYLQSLSLIDLKYLDCLPSCLPTLSSLQLLTIEKVTQLRELPDLPPSLCKLSLQGLENLDYLPSCLSSLSFLRELSIYNIPQLRDLPDLPPSLQELHIRYCHPELTKRYGRYYGSDRHKIAHVRYTDIS